MNTENKRKAIKDAFMGTGNVLLKELSPVLLKQKKSVIKKNLEEASSMLKKWHLTEKEKKILIKNIRLLKERV